MERHVYWKKDERSWEDMPKATYEEFQEDLDLFNRLFFKKNTFNPEEVYDQVEDKELILAADRQEALKRCDRLLNHLDWYGNNSVDTFTPMLTLRRKATEIRERVETIAKFAKVKWSNKGWKGWALEKKCWHKYQLWKRRHGIFDEWYNEGMYFHMGFYMVEYLKRMVENVRDCIIRNIKGKRRKWRFNYASIRDGTKYWEEDWVS